MSARLEQLLRETRDLTPEEMRVLCRVLLSRVAVPLRDPRDFYDDWDDPEVDAAYGHLW